jgi:hypothetical protein
VREVVAWVKAQKERCKRIKVELTMEDLGVILAEPENGVAPVFEVGEEVLVAYDIRRDAYRLGWIVTVQYLNGSTHLASPLDTARNG